MPGPQDRDDFEQQKLEEIEDELDVALWSERREEPTVSWAEVMIAHRNAAQGK